MEETSRTLVSSLKNMQKSDFLSLLVNSCKKEEEGSQNWFLKNYEDKV